MTVCAKKYAIIAILALYLAPSFAFAEEQNPTEEQQVSEPQPVTIQNADETPSAEQPVQQPAQATPPRPLTKEEIELRKQEMEKRVAELEKLLPTYPEKLELYFEYAKLQSQLGKDQEAIEALQHMLKADPNLGRVKLELGLLYIKTGRVSKLKAAKTIFEEVLASNPPENVQKNITAILAKVNQALKKDIMSFSVSGGFNQDSNANSAASTGETTYSNISIPLNASSQEQSDTQIFESASATHMHRFQIDSDYFGASITSNLTGYRTYQTSEHNLDLALVSFKTGPTIDIKKLNSQAGASISESLVVLNSTKYLKTRGLDLTLKTTLMNRLMLDYGFTFEYRLFSNSPSVTTNTNRTGHAHQHKIGMTYALTPKDVFNSSITWRNEEAPRADEFGNDQLSLSGGYTRQLPYGMSLNILGSFKKTHYNDLDTTVSTTTLRNDRERSLTFTLAKSLPKNVTLTASYQYKNSTSNIQNYDYANHRFSGAVGWTF